MGSRPAIPAQPAIACAAAPPIKTPMPEASPAFPIRSALTPARPLRRRRLSPAPSRSMSGPSSRPRLNGGGRPHIDFAVHRDTEDVGASIGASGSRVRSRSEPISTRSTTDLGDQLVTTYGRYRRSYLHDRHWPGHSGLRACRAGRRWVTGMAKAIEGAMMPKSES